MNVPIDTQKFAKRFNQRLNALGWESKDFVIAAQKLGYSDLNYSLLHFWRRGLHAPGTMGRVEQVAEVLGVTAEWLLGGK